MKGFERDTIMYEKGQEAERKNTERERQRADFAEKEKIINFYVPFLLQRICF